MQYGEHGAVGMQETVNKYINGSSAKWIASRNLGWDGSKFPSVEPQLSDFGLFYQILELSVHLIIQMSSFALKLCF